MTSGGISPWAMGVSGVAGAGAVTASEPGAFGGLVSSGLTAQPATATAASKTEINSFIYNSINGPEDGPALYSTTLGAVYSV